ncbi:MAG: class I SAM-dependent methyltransferase [Rhizobiaceae bacterium]|jgi:SAM-dependent methyltransferase
MFSIRVSWLLNRSNPSEIYSPQFFAGQRDGSRSSADVIATMVLEDTGAKSVIDVGCGVGTWAAAFMTLGCEVLGIDGDYVERQALHIPADRFRPTNLNRPPPEGVSKFDLAVSLEVAEHLDPSTEEDFLSFLTSLAPAILFSAAIPGQGGKGHVNERWQSHWVHKFKQRGFACHDTIRQRVWNDGRVKPWYAQNTFLFVKDGAPIHSHLPLDVVHPKTFMKNHRLRRKLFAK